MKQTIVIASLSEIDAAAQEFLRRLGDRRLVAFYAPMGAGKTTFITALCRVLGVRSDAGEPVYHFDFYRITKLEEALDIGLYDYLDSGALCLMEWPGNIAPLLPEETLEVSIEVADDGSRTLSWED